ncbi:MAG: hypothetical protein LT071_09975 [Nocardioides sp.]|nr:hypothetical protein [Nocardioides sp.]
MTSRSRRLTLAERRAEWKRIGFGTYGTLGIAIVVLATLGAMMTALSGRYATSSYLIGVAVALTLFLYLFLPPVMSSRDD